MKRLISWAACGLLISGSLASCKAWAQTGNPTAPPPGGANAPVATGAAGTTQPTGRPGTTSAAGGTLPTGRTGTSTPTSRQMIGNTGMFNRRDGAGAGGPNPASPVPGRANFSGGSTSQTLRPAGPITGGPNNTNDMFAPPAASRGTAFNQNTFNRNTINQQDALRLGAIRSAATVPLAPIVPIVPFAPEAMPAPTAAIAPEAPTAAIAPIIVLPTDSQVSGRTGDEQSIPVAPREAPMEQTGTSSTATATAFPVRNPTATGDATVTATAPAAVPAAVPRVVQSQMVEIPTGAPRTTAYRDNPSATAQRSRLTFSYPGYTQWQGHYWYHSPAAGWHYWDGMRWVQFASTEN